MNYPVVLCFLGGVVGMMGLPFAQAKELSSCHSRCFESKATCNAERSHTFNSCHDALTACKMSCTTGKPHETYHASPLLEIQFHPIVESVLL